MAGLIILICLIPILILLLLFSIHGKSSAQQRMLESMALQLQNLNQQIELLRSQEQTPVKKTFQQKMEEQVKTAEEIKTQAWKKEEPKIEPQVIVPVTPAVPEGTSIQTPPTSPSYPTPKTETNYEEEQSWWSRWLQNNPDMEKFIGENLANKIGIAVLVLGIAFFIKYAIDKEWIKEAGRVLIGLASGVALMGLGHNIRNKYRSFSSVLVGGGIAVLYFTAAFAFHQYHLIGQQTAFILMIGITVLAVFQSIYYDRLELAIIATLGGFITPFLVSTGQENYIALFIYLAILNTGLMALAWFKKWPVLTTIALFFTMIIYGGWLFRRLQSPEGFPFRDALFFDCLFYLLFITMTIINNLRVKRAFNGFDYIVLLTINLLFFGAGIRILGFWNEGMFRGLFTGSLGIFNLILAVPFYRNKTVDRNFVYLLIGLAVSFISLIAPIQLKGNQVTLFWAVEMVLLITLFNRTKINLLKYISLLIGLAMIANLIIDWSAIYFTTSDLVPVIFNKGFITGIICAIALLVYAGFFKNPSDEFASEISTGEVRTIARFLAIIVFYLAAAFEIHFQFKTRLPDSNLASVYLELFTCAYALLLPYVTRLSRSILLWRGLVTISAGMYAVNLSAVNEASFKIIDTGINRSLFIGHWITVILLLILFFKLIMITKNDPTIAIRKKRKQSWILTASITVLLSLELYQVFAWTTYTKTNWFYWENLYYKAGLTILWSFCSFFMMWLGMKYRFRTLRIISLTLFTITLVKLFIVDIRNIPPGGKIAAFIMLGILLLVVSFMYQRLKRIIIEE